MISLFAFRRKIALAIYPKLAATPYRKLAVSNDKSTPRFAPNHRIASIRRGKGLTLAQLATKMGVKCSLVTDVECCRQRASTDFLIAFCSALNVSADSILFGTEVDK